jgi:MAPEG family
MRRKQHHVMALDQTQTGVARGMALAVAVVVLMFAVAYILKWPNLSKYVATSSRLKLASLTALSPTAMLLICIARLAKHRFSTPQDIQGSALTEGTKRARLLQSLLQNTLEQNVLVLPIYFASSLFFPVSLLPLVVVATVLFAVGRLLFFIGYAKGAPSRAVGFGLTFYPSVTLFFLVIAVVTLRIAA